MDEYIEKNAAIAKLTRLEVTEPLSTMTDAKRMLADMPAADVAPVRRGRWLEAGRFDIGFWQCSCCGFLSEAIAAPKLYKYCPNCGAKMEVGNG